MEVSGEKKILKESDSIEIPAKALHRLKNIGRFTAEILEVARGSYIEEDDIIRVDDNYDRD